MTRRHITFVALLGALAFGCAPLHFSQTHVTSAPRPESADRAGLTNEPTAILGLQAPAALQGFSPFMVQALDDAISKASPSTRAVPFYRVVSALNEAAVTAEYADLITGFARSGILDRDRLQRIGLAVGARYVLLPGIAALDQVLIDKFEAAGFKVVRNRIVTLRLWLQLWDAQTGHLVWESTGESTSGSGILSADQNVPLQELAQALWLRMIRDGVAPLAVDGAGQPKVQLFAGANLQFPIGK